MIFFFNTLEMESRYCAFRIPSSKFYFECIISDTMICNTIAGIAQALNERREGTPIGCQRKVFFQLTCLFSTSWSEWPRDNKEGEVVTNWCLLQIDLFLMIDDLTVVLNNYTITKRCSSHNLHYFNWSSISIAIKICPFGTIIFALLDQPSGITVFNLFKRPFASLQLCTSPSMNHASTLKSDE